MAIIRESILANLQTTCEGIPVSAGFNTDVQEVERQKTDAINASSLPAIYIFEDGDVLLEEKSYTNDRQMTIIMECWLDTHVDLSVEVNKFYADIIKAVMTDRTRAGNAVDTKHTEASFFIDPQGNTRGGVLAEFQIMYRILPADPEKSSL